MIVHVGLHLYSLRGFIEKKLVGGGMDQSLVDTCTQEGHYKSIACKKALTL